MAQYLDILTDFVEAPPQAASTIRERPLVGLGIVCFLISGLSLFLAQSLNRHFIPMSLGVAEVILICLWRLLIAFLMTGFLHLFCELAGGQGSAVGLFVFLGISDLIWVLAVPIVLILRVAGFGQGGFVVWAALMALGFAKLALRAWGVRENYGMSLLQAWFMVCLPYVIILGLILAAISILVAGVVASLFQYFA